MNNVFHIMFYLLPYVFILLIGIFVYDLITRKRKESKFNKGLMLVISAMAFVLILYYLPAKNVLGKYYFSDIFIKTESSSKGVNISDRTEINKILNVINKHTFIRSAVRTTELLDIGDKKLIMFLINDTKRKKFIQIYSRIEHKDALMIINGQVYNSMNKKKFNQDIEKLINQLQIRS